jgi:hypothetical protein
MATKSTTQGEALRGVLSTISEMKAMPDADIPYLTNLETMVLGYLRAPFEAQQQAQQMSAGQGAPGAPPMGMPGMPPGIPGALLGGAMGAPGGPPGMPPGMPPGAMPGPPGPRVPGIMNHAPMPPVDELRRLLGK